jgi:ornithine decarboxylase
VSFHVGSFANSADAHALAIAKARRAFTLLEKYGFTPTLLDIGGGFSSETLETILPASVEINKAITEHGFDTCQVIAEPGRFLVEHAIELYTWVIGTKPGCVTIDESLYGAFNCVVMDHATPEAVTRSDGPYTSYTVFGCTCDGADVIGKASLPMNINVGDLIRWPRMGAYTLAATTNFNGLSFDTRERKYLP